MGSLDKRGCPFHFMYRTFSILLALFSFPVAALDAASPEGGSGFQSQAEVTGRHFMAVTANRHATAAAAEILELGGSAVDAAIAAQWVLNLVEPQSSGIGGGGFLVFWDARRQQVLAYDGRETAPRNASADFARGPDGALLSFEQLVATGKSVGTPGLLAMLAMAHETHGKLRWERLFRPAIRLAENGFPVSPRLHALLAEDKFLIADPAAQALYYPNGKPLGTGDWLVNRELGATLRLIAENGSQALYRGELADDIVRAVRARGGMLDTEDLRTYRPLRRTPVCGAFRQWRLCGMPPPSSGGLAVAQIMALLERVDAVSLSPDSADGVHLFAEAGRLAFADRARYVADPDFVTVPTAELLAPPYLDQRASLIARNRAMGTAAPGEFSQRQAHVDGESAEIPATTHLSIVDAEGNAVALTSSIESGFGSRIMVRGFLLNNQLTDFSFLAERDGKPVANRLQPRKRPMSSMSPTMVLDNKRKLHAVLGSPGGPRIINYTARTAWALLGAGLSPAQTVALPHIGNRNGATELEQGTAAESYAADLRQRDHATSVVPMPSGLHVIQRRGDYWVGAADPRREGLAMGH
jgi:gamma-glutamyltranspeptidase/glutathione hydrolase